MILGKRQWKVGKVLNMKNLIYSLLTYSAGLMMAVWFTLFFTPHVSAMPSLTLSCGFLVLASVCVVIQGVRQVLS